MLPRTLQSQGFTLIEITIVIALAVVIIGLTINTSINTLQSSSLRNERDAVTWALFKARSRAMSNTCLEDVCSGGLPHGVYIDFDPSNNLIKKYMLFQGDEYNSGDPLNETIAVNYSVSLGLDSISEIFFKQLSGGVIPSKTGSIILNDFGGRSYKITINQEGRIDWEE